MRITVRYFRCALSVTAFVEVGSGKNARMPDSNPSETLPPKHDPFDAPDAEDEADTRERVLEGGEDAGDGDAEDIRRELKPRGRRRLLVIRSSPRSPFSL